MSSEVLPPWLEQLATESWRGERSRGTIDQIDKAAVQRGFTAVTNCLPITVGRRLSTRGPTGRVACHLSTTAHQDGPYAVIHDHLEIDCHGVEITHLDAPNHFGVGGGWFRGLGPRPDDGVSVEDLAQKPIVTRAVFLDLVTVRGTAWIPLAAPVVSSDLEAAVARAGVSIEPGDALLLYMGRDSYEAAGHRYSVIAETPEGRPGISEDGARWIANSRASVVAWDLLDAHTPGELPLSVHSLTWAIGLLLVDNCDFRRLRPAIMEKPRHAGLLVISPLELEAATGCAVNPTVIV